MGIDSSWPGVGHRLTEGDDMIFTLVVVAAGVAGLSGICIGYAMGRYDRWLLEHPEDHLARRDRKAARL